MAWLRDLMNQAKPRARSYDALAESVLSHPEWPRDQQTRPRSLAALFSKFDRDLELEWLSHRPAVQQVLSAVLGCPLSSLTAHLDQGVEASFLEQHRFRFDDARFARPLELREEPLPPGIPSVLADPKRWDRLWWCAPSGSGRTLVGRWLESRSLARYVVASSASEASLRIKEASGAPLFIELGVHEPFDLGSLSEPRSICIAAPYSPTSAAWTRLVSPPVSSFVDELFDWLGLRLPQDGHFEKESALRWTREATASGVLGTFGAVIGLAGLIDEVGVGAIRNKSLEALSGWFVALRLKQAGAEGNPDAHWLVRHGFRLLTGLARQTLTDSPLPWTAPRSHDDWIALVPPELQSGVDADWVRLSLSKAVGRSAGRDLDRALRELPPGAFGVIRGLLAAHLLDVCSDSDLLRIAPHWLNLSTLEFAIEELCNESPFEWGEALLSPHAAPLILRRVFDSISHGELAAIEKTLELGARENPASTAATEACFRAAGVAVLAGQEIPIETLEPLYREGLTLLIELPERLPQPRLLHPNPEAPLSDRGILYLAALTLSEQLLDESTPSHSLLNPWREQNVDPRLASLLDEIERALNNAERADATSEPIVARIAVYALVDRLSRHFIAQQEPAAHPAQTLAVFRDAQGQIHPLEAPSATLRAFVSGTIGREVIEYLERQPTALQGLELLCTEQQLAWAEVARSLWLGWIGSEPLSMGFFELSTELGSSLWPHAPKAVFDKLHLLGEIATKLPFHCLLPEQWLWLPAEVFRLATLWSAIPVDMALGLLRSEEISPYVQTGLPVLWQRAPAELTAFVARTIEKERGSTATSLEPAFAVLHAAPVTETPALLPLLAKLLARTGLAVRVEDHAREWLLDRVAARAPEWRAAYTMLADLERRLRRTD